MALNQKIKLPELYQMTSFPAIEQLRLLNYQDGENVYYRVIADKKPRKLSAIFPAIPPELKTLN